MKILEIFENEVMPRDRSTIGKLADQLARAAYIESNQNMDRAKLAIEQAAKNVQIALIQKADVILTQLSMKEIGQ